MRSHLINILRGHRTKDPREGEFTTVAEERLHEGVVFGFYVDKMDKNIACIARAQTSTER